MSTLIFTLTILLSTVVVINILRAWRSISYLQSTAKNTSDSTPTNGSTCGKKIVVVIPALLERDRLPGTITYFLNNMRSLHSLKIVICTTAREPYKPGSGQSTYDLVQEMISHNPQQGLHLVHDPRQNGSMAHQINFAFTEMRRTRMIGDDDYIAIYNADSRPHPATMRWVYSQIINQNTFDVFQQSALFIRNFNDLNGILAKANALYQSFWTLSHEIPRLLNQSHGFQFQKRFYNAHCVGHGLFIRAELYETLGGLPEDTLTEDLNFGFRLRAMGKNISPIPYLENADAPSTYRAAFRQKKIWFWGPMLYPYYWLQHLRARRTHRFRATVIALQGWLSAWRWLAAGPTVALLFSTTVMVGPSAEMLWPWQPLQPSAFLRR
ncbi:glycosyltransferase family 2 protein [Pseudovibrio sp. Tun.PSC04-5.I4]|uniref:glycosyltransferase n=1 Tax=Pseudovibrio sp. Tun.PSC04-5.I4 TaxID=1798213 RepID=UPI000888512F|nr:glycosyltransferase family 2 protein [Pseudovibrio sp. Tun.PSC04-5.I4]SDQ28472.1 Glycosyltransferase, catalytic subunit of cellulose synthase and poly-beta-1,6-N-acetylglucosamine synthase [Pseudovibrio sp. Tun.PSC04-5.I4]